MFLEEVDGAMPSDDTTPVQAPADDAAVETPATDEPKAEDVV